MSIFGTRRNAPAMALVLGAVLLSGGQAAADQVIPDDLIVQGSECVGLDCVNNMTFNYDTLVLRENNLRIFFDDTSVSAGYPANKWRLIANSELSGGANFFAIEDATAVRQVFRVDAGARANSLYIASTGFVGFSTSTPALILHARRGDTPGLRFEQDASGGFTPQTWDIAGNESNFFIRDLTSGSRLPFRIRPGAPTSSLEISATGNVGFGVSNPTLVTGSSNKILAISATNNPILAITNTTANRQWGWYVDSSGFLAAFDANATANRFMISTAGTVRINGLTSCTSGVQTNVNGDLSCLSSTRQFKIVAGDLAPNVALANVMALRPQTGAYMETPDVPEHWLVAEDVAAVDPALAGLKDGKPYTVKTQNVVADLVAVIQQQQRRIDALERALMKR